MKKLILLLLACTPCFGEITEQSLGVTKIKKATACAENGLLGSTYTYRFDCYPNTMNFYLPLKDGSPVYGVDATLLVNGRACKPIQVTSISDSYTMYECKDLLDLSTTYLVWIDHLNPQDCAIAITKPYL